MEKLKLTAKKRTILGRKVKKLRKEGKLPANIYGKKIKSQAIEMEAKEFIAILSKAGKNTVVNLDIEGKVLPVLIQNVQKDPISDLPLHADFQKVDLKEKITAQIPLEIIGEAPAVKEKIGTLLTMLTSIEVEALPTDLPEKIEVDVSKLAKVDQSCKVSDLKVSDKVNIVTDGNLDIVKVAELVSKEAEEMVKEEEVASKAKEEAEEKREGQEEVKADGKKAEEEAKEEEEAKDDKKS